MRYDYYQTTNFSDLQMEEREVDSIFMDLQSAHNWEGSWKSSEDFHVFAGFKHERNAIHDWTPTETLHSVICEKTGNSVLKIKF